MKSLLPLVLSCVLSSPVIAGPFETALDLLSQGQSSKAVAQFQTAANMGHGEAQFNLSVMFAKGDGVLQDDQAALLWAWRARFSGIKRSVTLVDYLNTRLPTDMNDTIGAKLELAYSELFFQADPKAALAMGRIHNEVYPERNIEMAYKWFTIAAALDVKYAKAFREAVAFELDTTQRSNVQTQARATLGLWCETHSEQHEICTVLQAQL